MEVSHHHFTLAFVTSTDSRIFRLIYFAEKRNISNAVYAGKRFKYKVFTLIRRKKERSQTGYLGICTHYKSFKYSVIKVNSLLQQLLFSIKIYSNCCQLAGQLNGSVLSRLNAFIYSIISSKCSSQFHRFNTQLSSFYRYLSPYFSVHSFFFHPSPFSLSNHFNRYSRAK